MAILQCMTYFFSEVRTLTSQGRKALSSMSGIH